MWVDLIPWRPIPQLSDLFASSFNSDGKTPQKDVNHDASLSTPCKSEHVKLEQKGLPHSCKERETERWQNELLLNKFDTETGSVFIKP